jgi:hypothetical protein
LSKIAATKWKDSSTGQHVEYDQRPDMFRWDLIIFLLESCGQNMTLTIIHDTFLLDSLGELFDMLVFMLIWEELPVGEMILNLLLIHSSSFTKADCHGRATRYYKDIHTSTCTMNMSI